MLSHVGRLKSVIGTALLIFSQKSINMPALETPFISVTRMNMKIFAVVKVCVRLVMFVVKL